MVLAPESLGVDIGGVIIARADDDADTSFFSDDYLQTSAVPGAFDTLHRLVVQRFGERVFLVSKCGQRVQDRTLHWLDHHRFHDRTGIGRDRVHFCRQRHEKAAICETLGITHFVDDRLEVLSHLTTVGTLYLFQPQPAEVARFRQALARVRVVASWRDILAAELPQSGSPLTKAPPEHIVNDATLGTRTDALCSSPRPGSPLDMGSIAWIRSASAASRKMR